MPLPHQPPTKVLAISTRIHTSTCSSPRPSHKSMSSQVLHTKVRVICNDPDATESSSDEEPSLIPKRLVHEICLPARSSAFWAADCEENWGYGVLPFRISRQDLPFAPRAAEPSLRRPKSGLGRKKSCKVADEAGAADSWHFNFAASSGSFPKPQHSQKVKNARRVSRQYRRVRQRRWESLDADANRICGIARPGALCSFVGSAEADHDGFCSASNREFDLDGIDRTALCATECEDPCVRYCSPAVENLGLPNDGAEGRSCEERGDSSSFNCLGEYMGKESPSSVLESVIAYASDCPVPLSPVESPSLYLSDFPEELVLQPNLYTETDVAPSLSSKRTDSSLPFALPESSSNAVGTVVPPTVEEFPLFLAEFGQFFSFADAENCEIGKSLEFDSFDQMEDVTDITDISLDFDSEALTWINASEICVI